MAGFEVSTEDLILVERALAAPLPWDQDLRALIGTFTTNRDYGLRSTGVKRGNDLRHGIWGEKAPRRFTP
jgi:hypothetical protein